MIKFNPDDNMNFNEALNTLIEISQHQSGTPCMMDFSGVEIVVTVPPLCISPCVSSFDNLEHLSGDTIATEIYRRLEAKIPPHLRADFELTISALKLLLAVFETR